MKKQIISEEFKRMQKLAGVLNESILKIYILPIICSSVKLDDQTIYNTKEQQSYS